MIQDDSFVAVIPAAGQGKRFGTVKPKQYLELEGRTILERSISPLLQIKNCLGIAVMVNAKDNLWKELDLVNNEKVRFIEGGKSRIDSSINGINFWLESELHFSNILIHDAVRPCLKIFDLKNLLKHFTDLKNKNSAEGLILAKRSTDTIKLTEEDGVIKRTLDRDILWSALTPQIFSKEALFKAAKFYNTSNDIYTDESSLVEQSGGLVRVLEGSATNIKITVEEDLILAKSCITLMNQ